MATIAVLAVMGGVAGAQIDSDQSATRAAKDLKVKSATEEGLSQVGAAGVRCPGDREVVGGGAKVIGDQSIALRTSEPRRSGARSGYNQWFAQAVDTTRGGSTFSIKVYAICARD